MLVTCRARFGPGGCARPRGISLVEVILGLAVSAALMAGIARLMTQNREELRARNVAEHLAAVTAAAAHYFIANKEAMLQAMADGTDAHLYCVIDADPGTGSGGTVANSPVLYTCAFDVAWLKWQRALPQSFRATNVYHQKWTAIVKRVWDASESKLTDNVEMIVVGSTNGGAEQTITSWRELAMGSALVGGNGGFVPPNMDFGWCSYVNYQACGTQGGWRLDLRHFANVPW